MTKVRGEGEKAAALGGGVATQPPAVLPWPNGMPVAATNRARVRSSYDRSSA